MSMGGATLGSLVLVPGCVVPVGLEEPRLNIFSSTVMDSCLAAFKAFTADDLAFTGCRSLINDDWAHELSIKVTNSSAAS